jgi:hypothetical protein
MFLQLHALAIAFWLGIVGAEFVIERSRAAGKAHGYEVARNHYRIDLYLEIPAITVILLTGVSMLAHASLTPLLLAKAAAGLVAVGANAACVVPVVLRRQAADRDDLAAVLRHSRTIDLVSIVGAPAALAALVIGAFLLP